MILTAARSIILFALLAGILWPAFVRGQALAGRFYPEKQTYLFGEPIFIDFEIINNGEKPAWIDQRMGEPCIEPDPMEVVGRNARDSDGILPLDVTEVLGEAVRGACLN
jgi:hypothetical protein